MKVLTNLQIITTPKKNPYEHEILCLFIDMFYAFAIQRKFKTLRTFCLNKKSLKCIDLTIIVNAERKTETA